VGQGRSGSSLDEAELHPVAWTTALRRRRHALTWAAFAPTIRPAVCYMPMKAAWHNEDYFLRRAGAGLIEPGASARSSACRGTVPARKSKNSSRTFNARIHFVCAVHRPDGLVLFIPAAGAPSKETSSLIHCHFRFIPPSCRRHTL